MVKIIIALPISEFCIFLHNCSRWVNVFRKQTHFRRLMSSFITTNSTFYSAVHFLFFPQQSNNHNEFLTSNKQQAILLTFTFVKSFSRLVSRMIGSVKKRTRSDQETIENVLRFPWQPRDPM